MNNADALGIAEDLSIHMLQLVQALRVAVAAGGDTKSIDDLSRVIGDATEVIAVAAAYGSSQPAANYAETVRNWHQRHGLTCDVIAGRP